MTVSSAANVDTASASHARRSTAVPSPACIPVTLRVDPET